MKRTAFDLEEMISVSGKGEDCLDILLLANEGYTAGCCADYIQAIKRNSRHNVTIRNPMATSRLDKLLGKPRVSLRNGEGKDYDVVIIHYSICIIFSDYVSRFLRKSLRAFKGMKIQIIQDEYRWVNRMMAEMVYLGIDGILSLLEVDKLNAVYRHPGLKGVLKVSSLAGYISKEWERVDSPATAERGTHLIYRGNHLPYWLGNAAREKTALTKAYLKHLGNRNLVLDISSDPEDRIYGEDWLAFMKSGKAVIGLEGGASIFDFDESAEKSVRKYLLNNPEARYEEVHAKFLASVEGNVNYRMITPRSFEAIATKTVQVMYPGEYTGILEPWRHYVPMERDFSNANEVCDLLTDDVFLQKMADDTFTDIIGSGKFNEERLGLGVDSMISYISRNP